MKIINNIFYGLSFLIIIYYVFIWKKNLKVKQKELLSKKMEKFTSPKVENDIKNEGNYLGLFKKVAITDEQNLCNTQLIPASFKGVYSNEIEEGLNNSCIVKK